MSEPKTKKELRDHDISMAEQEIWRGLDKLYELGCVNILREIHSGLGEKLQPKGVAQDG